MNENFNPIAFVVAMGSSLRLGKESMALDLFRAAKRKNIEVRHHYFWPLLVKRGKENDCSGMRTVRAKGTLYFNKKSEKIFSIQA